MRTLLSSAVVTLLLAACASPPPKAPSGTQSYTADLGDGVLLAYQVERKSSGVRSDACFSLLTGTLMNNSAQALSRTVVVDFKVMSSGQMLFRDITTPVADIPAGGRAALKLIASPTHRGECPNYDRIDVALRRGDGAR